MKAAKSIPLHPLIWALFPPLALLGNNISQLSPGDAVRSLMACLVMAVLAWMVFRLLLRDWQRSGVVTTAFLVLFFSYGHVYRVLEDRLVLGINLGRHRFLLVLFALVLVAVIIWALRAREVLRTSTALNLIGVIALIFPLYQVLSYQVKASVVEDATPGDSLLAEVANLQLPPGSTPPDIYYIILDSYTRSDTLKTQFAYDNSGFLGALGEDGFYIAGCSQSNYSYTTLSLASALNFNYLETINPNLPGSTLDETAAYPYLFNNAVAYTLRRLGYRFVTFESGFSPTELKDAQEYYTQGSDWLGILLEDGINPFEAMLLDSSAGMFLYELSPHLPARVQKFLSLDTAYVVHRNRILYTLNRLSRLADTPGPKFIFAHLLAPHNPFVFGPHGEYIERKTPFTLNDDRDVVLLQDYASGYRDQATYLNQRVLEIVGNLIRDSDQPPIIILQGDHGVPRLAGWNDTILNAYYLPSGGDARLYPNISPVNTFRVIFDYYFGGSLSLLPDASCTTNAAKDPFGCTPLADPNPSCTP